MRRLYLILLLCFFVLPAQAMSLISDEETESWLYDLLTPIFKAASLPLNRDYVHIIKDDSLNAFVGDQNHMFIHTGTLTKATNSNEIEGVLAHETGHILGGHILRLKIQLRDMQKATLASLVAAAGAAAASGRGDAAIAVVLGTQSAAINAVTAYQMTEERAADETAVILLNKNNKSVRGLKDFMSKIQSTNRLQGIEESSYFRTHPITSERIAFFNEKLNKESAKPNQTDMDKRLKRIQAKIIAYIAPLPQVLQKYPLENKSIEATIAHTVYYMRLKDFKNALKYAEELLAKEPNNPYFWELKSQALFESGNTKAAVTAYKKTLSLKPNSDLFKISYAEAVLASTPSRQESEAIIPLLEQTANKTTFPNVYHLLGQAYDNLGQTAIANYFAAEYNAAIGETALASRLLEKAFKATLRPDIKLRAEDLKAKLAQDNKRKSLF